MTIGGVIHNLTAKWFLEEIMYNEVANLSFDEHCKGCHKEYHDNCWESLPSDTILVGAWEFNDTAQQWHINKELGEYAAIVGEIYTQIVWSEHTKMCAMCSPCYPGQGDLDTPGNYETYDLPADMYQHSPTLPTHTPYSPGT